MLTFSPTHNQYIPSVKLETLANTFNTLEQGHKEAVKAASDLQTAVADLDMNEAEDEFKQGIVDGIDTIVKENTVYGNAAGAVDDLIMRAGKIATSQAVKGRLRSQKAFKEYQDKVDKSAIPEGMKQMYKELNPYHYEDGEKDKNGRITAGKTWEANSNPVATVSRAEISKHALSIAAKEAGGGQSVTFLTEDGKETTDFSKSFDGQIYKKTGSNYERLGADKIAAAYQQAIKDIPGAADSLQQDYNYEKWKWDKAKKANKDGSNPVIEGFTDKDGNIYDFDTWNRKNIQGFSKLAAYNHVHSTIEYGAEGPAYKARQLAKQGLNSDGTPIIKDDTGDYGNGQGVLQKVVANPYAVASNNVNTTNKVVLDILRKHMGKDFNNNANGVLNTLDSITDIINIARKEGGATGPGSAANWYISKYGKNMTPEEKHQLRTNMMAYVVANAQRKKYLSNLDPNTRDGALGDLNRAQEIYTNDNKFGKEMIAILNDIYSNNKTASYEIGSEVMNHLSQAYGNINSMKEKGINVVNNGDGTYHIEIDSQHRNLLPKFDYLVSEADSKVSGKAWNGIKHWFGVTSETNVTRNFTMYNRHRGDMSSPIASDNYLTRHYANGINEVNSKVQNSEFGDYINWRSTDAKSYQGLYYRMYGKQLGLTEAEIKSKEEAANKYLDNALGTYGIAMGRIEEVGGEKFNSSINTPIALERQADAANLIRGMYNGHSNLVSRTAMNPLGGTDGRDNAYLISFTVPKELANDSYKEGKQVTFMVSGLNIEGKDPGLASNPTLLKNNAFKIATATGTPVNSIEYSKALGNTDLQPTYIKKNGQKIPAYIITLGGYTRTISRQNAENLVRDLYTLEQQKSIAYDISANDTNKALQFSNSLAELANDISANTGIQPKAVYNMMIDYIKE